MKEQLNANQVTRHPMTSDYSNCPAWGPSSRGSRTVKTHRTCPAFRDNPDCLAELLVSGWNITQLRPAGRSLSDVARFWTWLTIAVRDCRAVTHPTNLRPRNGLIIAHPSPSCRRLPCASCRTHPLFRQTPSPPPTDGTAWKSRL